MKKGKMKLTAKRLSEVFTFDETTGRFFWKVDRPRRKVGDVAGCTAHNNGWQVCVDGKTYRRAHLVWLWCDGWLPTMRIKHVTQNPFDDRRENLIAGGFSHMNLDGMWWSKQWLEWRVSLVLNGEETHFGMFDHVDDAIQVRDMALKCGAVLPAKDNGMLRGLNALCAKIEK